MREKLPDRGGKGRRKISPDSVIPMRILFLTLYSAVLTVLCILFVLKSRWMWGLVAVGTALLCFAGGLLSLGVCRRPLADAPAKEAGAIVVKDAWYMSGAGFVLKALGALFLLGMYLSALEMGKDSVIGMSIFALIGVLSGLVLGLEFRYRRVILLPEGILITVSSMGKRRRFSVKNVKVLEICLASNEMLRERSKTVLYVSGYDKRSKKILSFNTSMVNGDAVYESLCQSGVKIKGRTLFRRGLSQEELMKKHYAPAWKDEDYTRQNASADKLRLGMRLGIWVVCIGSVGCMVGALFLPESMIKKTALFLAAVFPLGYHILYLAFPQALVWEGYTEGTSKKWRRYHAQIPGGLAVLETFLSIMIIAYIREEWAMEGILGQIGICVGLCLLLGGISLKRMPKRLRQISNEAAMWVSTIALCIGLGVSFNYTVSTRDQTYQIQEHRTQIRYNSEGEARYYVKVSLSDGKDIEIRTDPGTYAAVSGGFPITVEEWKGLCGVRFIRILD